MIYILNNTYTSCWVQNRLQRDKDGSRETNEVTPVVTRREVPGRRSPGGAGGVQD